MKQGISNKWKNLHRKIIDQCESLGMRYGGNYTAVNLRSIAEECKIEKVEFRPMLLDGGIGYYKHGFAIYVKCDPEEVDGFERNYLKGSYNLPSRIRFTIAHEIVHTLFFDRSQIPPKPLVSGRNTNQLKSLERECNAGASRLLLPNSRIDPVLQNEKILSPEAILQLSKDFRVSLKAMILRLEQRGTWGANVGLISIIDTFNPEQPSIDSLAVSTYAKGYFPDFNEDGERVLFDGQSVLEVFGGSKRQQPFQIACRDGSRQRCIAECWPLNRYKSKFILTARIEE